MSIPQAVQRRGDEAAEYLKGQGAQQGDQNQPERSGYIAPPPAAGNEPAPGPQGEAASGGEDPNSETWRQRFEVLQGKYDHEVHQDTHELVQRAERLAGQLRQAQGEIERLRQAPPAAEPSGQASANGSADAETFASIESDYPDLAPAIQALRRQIAAKDAEIERLEGQVSQVAGDHRASEGARYERELEQAVPDWREVNAREDWLQWLGQIDARTGRKLDDLLQDAHSARDASRVAAFFRDFQRTRGQAQGATAGEPHDKPSTASDPRASQVQPDVTRGRAGDTAAEDSKPHYDREQIKRWSTELARDPRRFKQRYGYSDGDIEAIQRDMFVAQQEGRIG